MGRDEVGRDEVGRDEVGRAQGSAAVGATAGPSMEGSDGDACSPCTGTATSRHTRAHGGEQDSSADCVLREKRSSDASSIGEERSLSGEKKQQQQPGSPRRLGFVSSVSASRLTQQSRENHLLPSSSTGQPRGGTPHHVAASHRPHHHEQHDEQPHRRPHHHRAAAHETPPLTLTPHPHGPLQPLQRFTHHGAHHHTHHPHNQPSTAAMHVVAARGHTTHQVRSWPASPQWRGQGTHLRTRPRPITRTQSNPTPNPDQVHRQPRHPLGSGTPTQSRAHMLRTLANTPPDDVAPAGQPWAATASSWQVDTDGSGSGSCASLARHAALCVDCPPNGTRPRSSSASAILEGMAGGAPTEATRGRHEGSSSGEEGGDDSARDEVAIMPSLNALTMHAPSLDYKSRRRLSREILGDQGELRQWTYLETLSERGALRPSLERAARADPTLTSIDLSSRADFRALSSRERPTQEPRPHTSHLPACLALGARARVRECSCASRSCLCCDAAIVSLT